MTSPSVIEVRWLDGPYEGRVTAMSPEVFHSGRVVVPVPREIRWTELAGNAAMDGSYRNVEYVTAHIQGQAVAITAGPQVRERIELAWRNHIRDMPLLLRRATHTALVHFLDGPLKGQARRYEDTLVATGMITPEGQHPYRTAIKRTEREGPRWVAVEDGPHWQARMEQGL